MLKRKRNARTASRSILLVVAILTLFGSWAKTEASAYYSLSKQSQTTITSPEVVLQNGTAGTSTVYTNSTSAKARAIAPAPTPTYYPNSYNILTGTYLSGGVPSSVQNIDTNYFVTQSSPTATSTMAYNPSSYSLLGNTNFVSGTTADLISNNASYMTFRSYASTTAAQPLYTHLETTTIGGSTYYLLRLTSADAAGLTLSGDAGTLGRKLMGRFVYPLTGVSSIPASTWTIYYRASQGHVNVESHGDIDILIRRSDGTIRSTIATNVANSAALTATTSWVTLSGTYSWGTYNVVDQTDYLEIDYYIEVTVVKATYLVNLRIDDNTLAVADQTRATNINLPNQYTSEVEFIGSSNTQPWYQLVWSIDSAWTTGSVAVSIQVYNYTLGGYPVAGNGYYSYTSSSTANTDETKSQTITENPTAFRNGTSYWKLKMKGVKSTTTQFDLKIDWVEYKPSHYTEYTVSTEFLFSSMTTNTPAQLNFTVVTHYNVSNVNVTIQIWSYASSSYVTSGEGYATYISVGSGNETTYLNINTSPQSYTSSGSAKINVTGVLAANSAYQQETNQIKLVYKYDASPSYDYLLRVNNTVTDSWLVRLKKYDNSSIGRLENCTIYFHNSTDGASSQIVVENGAFVNETGVWYDLDSFETIYIAMTVEANSTGTSYVYVYLEVLIPDTSTYAQYIITFEIA